MPLWHFYTNVNTNTLCKWISLKGFGCNVMCGKCIKDETSNVVYFDQLLGAARTQELVKTFFHPFFNLFLFISKLFQWFHSWNKKKRLKMNKKTWFCLLLKAGRHAKTGRLPKGVPQNCLFSVDFLLFLLSQAAYNVKSTCMCFASV